MPSGIRSTRRSRVVLAAGLLFAAIFAARFLDSSPTSGLTLLYVIPIVLLGVELGLRAGVAAGMVGFALFAGWTPFAPIPVDPAGYVTRAVAFLLVGAIAGYLADRLHQALASADASARHFELTRDLLCTANLDGWFTHLNGAWETCLGWTRAELMSRPFVEFVHPDDLAVTEAEAAGLARGESTVRFRNRYRHKDGRWVWIEWSSQLDAERGLIHAAARDVTEERELEHARRAAEAQLRFLADHDPLSGVCNRRRFERELRRELGSGGRRGVVLVIDVDDFKGINDTFGHGTGDAVIVRLGETLRERMRSGDLVARLGGDEFAVLLRRTEPREAQALARDLQARVGERLAQVLGAEESPGVTLSVGLAGYGGAGVATTVDELLGRADRALYAAKSAGKDRVVAAA